jgi:hypothetical protein
MPDAAERERDEHQALAEFLDRARYHLTRALGAGAPQEGFDEHDHWDGAELAVEEANAVLDNLVRGSDDPKGLTAARRVRELSALIAAHGGQKGTPAAENRDDIRNEVAAAIASAVVAIRDLRNERGIVLEADFDDLLDQ